MESFDYDPYDDHTNLWYSFRCNSNDDIPTDRLILLYSELKV